MKTNCCALLALALGLFAVGQVRADGANWQDPDYQAWRHLQDDIISGGGSGIGGGGGPRRTYTAIAYSPSLGRHGWGKNYSTPGAAKRAAMKTCGGRDVQWIICGASGSYIAMAVGKDGAAGAAGRTAAEAKAIALEECRQHTTHCQVTVTIYAP